MSKVIISLVGVKRSGKSTSAEYIEYLLPEATNVAIADKLKLTCAKAFDIDMVHFTYQELKEEPFLYPIRVTVETLATILDEFKLSDKPVNISSDILLELATKKLRTPRDILQTIGMFIRQVYGKKIHMDHLDLSNDITIVSDLRMKSEFDYISNLKGYKHIPIYVENKEAESVGDLHISEKEYLKFKDKCIRLDNNIKDYDTLADNIENILIKYRKELDL